MSDGKIKKSDEEWRAQLTEEQFRITRQAGTEPAFTGKYNDHKGDGTYLCIGCGTELFGSDKKFNSGSGWPSFTEPAAEAAVEMRTDNAHGMTRTEVVCARCDAHLGHVFPDGPAEAGGQRFCINSAAIDFEGNEPE